MVGGNYGGQYCLLLGCHTYSLHHNYYYYSDREFVPAFNLKLASTFVEEKLTPLNSLQFSTQVPLLLIETFSKDQDFMSL